MFKLHRMLRLPFLLPLVILGLGLTSSTTQAQWLEWDIQTEERLMLSSVANADDEEKDLWPADLNKDGWLSLIHI